MKTQNWQFEKLREAGYKVYAVEQVENSISLEKFESSLEDKIAVIFGNEVTGVEQTTIANVMVALKYRNWE
ncbi:MAG: TrmH family RNA methyltransferase [Ferruginibacter sp.]